MGNQGLRVEGGCNSIINRGKLQHVNYVADAAGFRVADSRLPVAPVYDGVAPAPVEDTPEVAEARAAHLAAVEAAKAETVERRRRDADPAVLGGASRVISAPTPFIHNAPVRPVIAAPAAPLGYYGYGGYPLAF